MAANTEKRIFQVSLVLLVLGAVFAVGLYSGVKRNIFYRIANGAATAVSTVFEERETLLATEPEHFLQPSRYEGSGVTVNEAPDSDSLILVSGFFEDNPGLRLMRRDGTVVRDWPAPHSEFFPDTSFLDTPPATDWNIDIHGQVLMPDGSVVFNFEYGGTVKLDRCGETLWTLEHPTHHSVERAEAGGYWILGRSYIDVATENPFPPFTEMRGHEKLMEDLILLVDDDGRIVAEKSIPALLYENGYAAVLTAKGENFSLAPSRFSADIVHSNKIAELSSEMADAFPDFAAGDLVVSLRGYNMLFLVDPDTWEVKWLQTGPWVRQHDPEFDEDGTIVVFNNNTYFRSLRRGMRAREDAPRVSNIMRFDPATGETRVVYGGKPGQEFVTTVRGKVDLRPNGGFMISEHEAGRVFEVDAGGDLIWEFINRYSAEEVVEITEGRVYPADYFSVTDWSCG